MRVFIFRHHDPIRRWIAWNGRPQTREVVEIAPAEECEHEMFVMIRWKSRQLAVPLMQLEGIDVDEETQQAIEDWHYWVDRGYEM